MHRFLLLLCFLANCPFMLDVMAQCSADLNGNQLIDNDDLMILLADYGTSCEYAAWDDPVISEIHYNPSTQQGTDYEYEFVELMNPHPFAINLSGWVLADGMGASLEWKGGIWDNNQSDAWVGSNALGGSPGSDNSTWAD